MFRSLVSVVYPFSARSRKSLFLVRRIPQTTMDDQYPRLRSSTYAPDFYES